MGRPPSSGGTSFRFTPAEVAEMDACLQQVNNAIPTREVMSALAEKFSTSSERAGKIIVQPKQVWNWFQNRRYAQRTRTTRAHGKINLSPASHEDSSSYRNAPHSVTVTPEMVRSSYDNNVMEFEAKSARDGAWYDVATFLSHRMFETGDPEVRVRFAGFGVEEDEWVNVCKCVRHRSLPCEAPECVVVLPGDLILCFQEGKDQALYFDARVLDAQRRRHDIRGCRCRFLVRYEHDQSEEIVPLRKICRRPETDFMLQILQASKAFGQMDLKTMIKDSSMAGTSKEVNMTVPKHRNAVKLDTYADEVMTQSKVVTTEVGAPVATISEVPGGHTEGIS